MTHQLHNLILWCEKLFHMTREELFNKKLHQKYITYRKTTTNKLKMAQIKFNKEKMNL